MVFYGEYTVAVTEGGRIAIPKKIRENLTGEMLILTKGFDICLAGYDSHDWQKRTAELMNVSLLDKEHIDKRRVLFSGAHEIEFDDQGRCVIPKSLMNYIGGSKKVKIVGIGDHFEIWSEEAWITYLEKTEI